MGGFDVATVGDNCIDRYGPPRSLALVGGNAVNVAVQLARLGLRVAYFGAVGDDDDGRRVVACLRENGVATRNVRVVAGRTAFTDIAFRDGGERVFAFEDFGVCRGYRPEAEEVAVLAGMRHVHLGWLDDGGALKRRLSASGAGVSQDLSVNAEAADVSPAGLTIAFVSAEGTEADADALLVQTRAGGAGIAVVTRGVHGSAASDEIVRAETGVVPVDVTDTTGAGDSFIAGFIAARLAGRDLQDCLEAGRDRAALACTHLGGFPQKLVPWNPG